MIRKLVGRKSHKSPPSHSEQFPFRKRFSYLIVDKADQVCIGIAYTTECRLGGRSPKGAVGLSHLDTAYGNRAIMPQKALK